MIVLVIQIGHGVAKILSPIAERKETVEALQILPTPKGREVFGQMLLAHGHLGMAQHVAQLGWHLVVNALHGKEERIFVRVAKRSYLKE